MARLSYYARLTSGASAVIRAFRTLLYVALLVTALPALAQTAHQRLDGMRATVEQVEQALKRARAADGQDDPPETLGDFRLLSSRY